MRDGREVRSVLVTYADGSTEEVSGTGFVDRVRTYTPRHGGTDLPPPKDRTDHLTVSVHMSVPAPPGGSTVAG